MPIVSLPKESDWQDAQFKGDFSDENFGFLGLFQEILPGELEGKKKSKKKKTKEVKEADEGEPETKGEDEGKKKLRKKKKNKEKVEVAKEEEEPQEKTDDGQDESKKESKKKNKKMNKKRKNEAVTEETPAAKKVRFDDSKKKDEKTGKEGNQSKEDVAAGPEEAEKMDMSAWDRFNLDERILSALRKLKFTTPTTIQENVILPATRDRMDILGAAETGSGKTFAFAIPVLSRLLAEERQGNGPRALVMAPTRELAVQIVKSFASLCKFTKFSITSIVGGLAEVKQLRVMEKRHPEVVVATPGRLWDLMQQATGGSSYLSDFSGLQCLVVDETDRMVEQGHFKEMNKILDTVRSSSNFAQAGKLQTLVFSATLTYVLPEKTTRPGQEPKQKQLTTQEKTKLLVEATGMREQQHKVVDLTRKFGTAEKLVETRFNCTGLLDKDTNIVYLLKRYSGRTLIFTNSVDASRRLYGILNLLQFSPMMLHANMIQRQRLRNLERFAAQPNSILLATDVAARGLDIKGIEHVIHYQVPKTAEMYIHRSGRTARASESGLTVLMVDPKDAHLYRKICRNLNRDTDLPVFPVDTEDLRNSLQERVKLASDLDTLAHRAKKIKLNETWFEKAAREADLDLDHRDRERDQANDEYNSLLRKQDQVKVQLREAMRNPLPEFQKQKLPMTRFITPELKAMYDKEISSHALDNLQEQLDAAVELKRRTRKAVKAHNLKGRQFKKK